MTRTRFLSSIGALLAASAAILAAGPASAEAPSPYADTAAAPARLLVSAQEWGLTLSRLKVRSGPIVIQLDNRGEDPHDLRLRRLTRRGRQTGRTIVVPETAPGELAEIEDSLRRARWRLWCSLPGHKQLGMRATLTAR